MLQRGLWPDLAIQNFKYSFRAVHMGYALLFALILRQQPLFTGNQNTKFLHAAADAGIGFLAKDWTARTVDPLPAFTVLARIVFAVLPQSALYLLFAFLSAVFAYAAVGIAAVLHEQRSDRTVSSELALIFGIILIVVSSISITMTRGVAGQYMLAETLQPCVFGVFALLALFLWLRGYFGWAAFSLSLSAIFHPGAYLLTAIIMLLALMISTRKELTLRSAAIPIAVFALIVGPVMAYQAMTLAPTTPEAFARATEILANERIPRHTDVRLWFDLGAASKFAWMVLACYLVRRQPQIFWSLTALTAFGLITSLGLLIWPVDSLRFSTPWRVTAVSMPLATIIVAYYCSAWLSDLLHASGTKLTLFRRVAFLVFAVLSASMMYKAVIVHAKTHPAKLDGAVAYAKSHATENQLYLVPVGEFGFRLETGIPVFVTFKTHPYKDVEVLEWRKRVDLASAFYNGLNAPGGQSASWLDSYGVTHVLLPAQKQAAIQGFTEVYSDPIFAIHARTPATP